MSKRPNILFVFPDQLSGAAGLTYGAAGIWHAGTKEDYGICYRYDRTTWEEGMIKEHYAVTK